MRTAGLTRTPEHCLRRCHSDTESHGLRQIPRLQHRRGPQMVSHLPAPHWHDLHRQQSAPVPQHSRLHHLQELDNYPDRIRRGALVRRICHQHDPAELRSHGLQLHHCGLGGHLPRALCPRWRQRYWRGRRQGCDAQLRLHLDVDQLLLLCCVCPGHAQAHQAHQLQGL